MHLNHYENPYSRLAQHMSCAGANMVHCPGYADDLRQYTTLNSVGVGVDPIVGVGPALVIMSTLSLEYLLMFPY